MTEQKNSDEKKPEKIGEKLEDWRKSQTEAYRVYVRTSAVGLEFGLAIAVGALLGYFADKYFHSAPYGLIIGLIFGSIAAGKRMYQFVKNYLKKNDNDE